MKCINATKFHRKSGGAKRRDLQFDGPLLEMFFDRTERFTTNGPSINPTHSHTDRRLGQDATITDDMRTGHVGGFIGEKPGNHARRILCGR
jgi:hypothetical protein